MSEKYLGLPVRVKNILAFAYLKDRIWKQMEGEIFVVGRQGNSNQNSGF